MGLLSWIPHRGTLPALPSLSEIAAGPGTPVVFLHGFLASPNNFELPLTALMREGIPVAAPAYGDGGTARVDESFAQLKTAVQELLDASPTGRVDVVGHSLGGHLGLRLAHHYPPGTVRTLVGLGAAFRGVPYRGRPWLLRAAGAIAGPGVAEVLRPEPWEASAPAGTRVVSIVSSADRVVPVSSADVGELVRIDGVIHENLPQVTRPVLEALDWRP